MNMHAVRGMAIGLLALATIPCTTQAADFQTQDKPWSYHCNGDTCTIGTSIHNDDNFSVIALELDAVVDRRVGVLKEVLFTLPLGARGKAVAFAFAKVRTDGGEHHIDIVPGSTRTLTITDCGAKTCRIYLPNGLLNSGKDTQALDVGAEMLADNQMLIDYPSGADRYRTSVLLSGLQARERQLKSGEARP